MCRYKFELDSVLEVTVPVEDPWRAKSGDGPVEEQDAKDARRQLMRRARHDKGSASFWWNLPFRARRGVRFGILGVLLVGLVAVLLVATNGARPVGPKPPTAKPRVVVPTTTPGPAPAVASVPKIIQNKGLTGQGEGMTGQILGIGGLCLADGNAGSVAGNTVVLATCTGTEEHQEWILLANKEIALDGYCLGIGPGSAKLASVVGLYTCNDTASVMWNVQSNGTIQNVGSDMCLGSWENKDIAGNLVWVTACEPTAQSQIWIVPSYSVDPSGLAMPVGNVPGWAQVFTDDFNENVPLGQFPATVSNKWKDYPDGWHDTTGNGTYEPTKVVSIQNGIMNLFLHTENGVHMVSAPEPIIPGATGMAGGTLYGMYEVRFKAQPVVGYKTAWLLWPDSNQQTDGEIDFPEGNLQLDIHAYMHHVGNPMDQDSYATPDTYAGWHTATTIWTADSVVFMLDGQVIGDSTDPSVIPHKPMHWVLQTETQTNGSAPSDAESGNVEIDWVSVWLPQNS